MNKVSKRVKMTGVVLSTAVVSVFSPGVAMAQSQEMVSDWSMVLPASSVNEVIQARNHRIHIADKTFDYTETLPKQSTTVKAVNLSLLTGFSVKTAKFGQNGEVSVGGGFQSLSLRIGRLDFSTSMEVATTPNAPPMRTEIVGSCSGIEAIFMLPVQVDVSARVPGDGAQVIVDSWKWNVGDIPFMWMTKSCEGPKGMSEFLRQNVFQKFVGSEQARQAVLSEVEGVLNGALGGVMGSMFSQSIAGLTASFKVDKFAWTSELFTLDGSVTLKADKKCSAFTLSGSRTRVALDTASRSGIKPMQLMFPEEAMLKAIQCSHENQALSFDSSTADLPDFVSLMKSRTNQSFVWPDLGSFPTTQSFMMKTMTTDKFVVTPASVTSGFSGTLATQLTSYWTANTGAYVTFWTPLTANVRINIEGADMVLSVTQARNVSLSYRFERKVSDTYIDKSQFQQPVVDFVSKIKQSWPLPSVELPNKRKFMPSGFTTVPGKVWTFTMKN